MSGGERPAPPSLSQQGGEAEGSRAPGGAGVGGSRSPCPPRRPGSRGTPTGGFQAACHAEKAQVNGIDQPLLPEVWATTSANWPAPAGPRRRPHPDQRRERPAHRLPSGPPAPVTTPVRRARRPRQTPPHSPWSASAANTLRTKRVNRYGHGVLGRPRPAAHCRRTSGTAPSGACWQTNGRRVGPAARPRSPCPRSACTHRSVGPRIMMRGRTARPPRCDSRHPGWPPRGPGR